MRTCKACGVAKPLAVLWLCATHHGERHRLINRRVPAEGWPAEWPHDLRVREFPVMEAARG